MNNCWCYWDPKFLAKLQGDKIVKSMSFKKKTVVPNFNLKCQYEFIIIISFFKKENIFFALSTKRFRRKDWPKEIRPLAPKLCSLMLFLTKWILKKCLILEMMKEMNKINQETFVMPEGKVSI